MGTLCRYAALALLVPMLSASFAAAQGSRGGNSGKALDDWTPAGRFVVLDFPWSRVLEYSRFDLPESKIAYNGHEVSVRANVAFSKEPFVNGKRLMKLAIFLTPDNTDGFCPARKDSISRYATYNTVVMQNLMFNNEGVYTLKGEADVYARSFSPGQCTAADKARLIYTAHVDMADPSASTIECRLSGAEWAKADTVVLAPSNQGYRYSGFVNFLMHDMGAKVYGNYTTGDGVEHVAKRRDMLCEFRFTERYIKNNEEAEYYNVDTDLRELQALFALRGEYLVDPPEKNRDGHISITHLTTTHYDYLPDGKGINVVMATKRDGKITGQYENLELTPELSYSDGNKPMKLDVRFHAKCRVIKVEHEETPHPQFLCEQATVSCLIHD